jgi:hypothetical protein
MSQVEDDGARLLPLLNRLVAGPEGPTATTTPVAATVIPEPVAVAVRDRVATGRPRRPASGQASRAQTPVPIADAARHPRQKWTEDLPLPLL